MLTPAVDGKRTVIALSGKAANFVTQIGTRQGTIDPATTDLAASILRGHYGYFGVPHNWRSLNGFLQEVRRIWFNCLRRRSRKNRRMARAWFDAVTYRFPLPQPRITHP